MLLTVSGKTFCHPTEAFFSCKKQKGICCSTFFSKVFIIIIIFLDSSHTVWWGSTFCPMESLVMCLDSYFVRRFLSTRVFCLFVWLFFSIHRYSWFHLYLQLPNTFWNPACPCHHTPTCELHGWDCTFAVVVRPRSRQTSWIHLS